jgi:hypothetical protein
MCNDADERGEYEQEDEDEDAPYEVADEDRSKAA